jgi:hypothetical protein
MNGDVGIGYDVSWSNSGGNLFVAGYVGIGISSNPSATLDIHGAARV